MYDLAFGESGCFHRLNKVKVFPFLISPKFGEDYNIVYQTIKAKEVKNIRYKALIVE
jgi:hypothetical protein